VDDLTKGVDFARRFSKTDHLLAFDGAVGGLNVSGSLAEELSRLAPDVAREVDGVLMPKWLRQRALL
jgi:hypothetical protein